MTQHNTNFALQNERVNIKSAVASIVSQTLVNGYIPLFAISVLGVTNQQIGLINSLPSLIGLLAMIPGVLWINRLQSKKTFTAMTTLSTRFLFFFMFLLPFLPIEGKGWLLVMMIALMNFPGAIANLSWQSFIGEIVPEDRRGNFFSQRSRITTFAGMVITLVTGYALELFDKQNPVPYQVLFLLGFLFGIVEVYYLMKNVEMKKNSPSQKVKAVGNKLKPILTIFKNKPYVYFIACALFFNFGWQMAWPIFTIYQIKDAHATSLWLSLFSVANQVAQIVSYRWWGKMADKRGNMMMLFIAAMGMATAPFLTVLSTNFIYLTVINLWIGLFVAGTNMLLFNQLLNVTPDNRTGYLANYNVLLGLIGFVAPQIGVLLLDSFGMLNSMVISSIVRVAGGVAFLVVAYFLERKVRQPEVVI